MAAEPLARRRYFLALRDGCRTALSLAEVSALVWCMRFKADAGPQLTALDPW